jgi:hypothetical protein
MVSSLHRPGPATVGTPLTIAGASLGVARRTAGSWCTGPADRSFTERPRSNEELNLTGGFRRQLARCARELHLIGSAGRLTPAR